MGKTKKVCFNYKIQRLSQEPYSFAVGFDLFFFFVIVVVFAVVLYDDFSACLLIELPYFPTSLLAFFIRNFNCFSGLLSISLFD